MDDLIRHEQQINQQLARYGVKFGIYKNGTFHERLFPFDPIPRVITAQEWAWLERGLAQRVKALNLFLADIYGPKKILADGIVPEDFVYRSPGYLPPCEGITPPGGVYSHISGIDLVKGKDGAWYVLEDNLRIPSGGVLSPHCPGAVPPVQPRYVPPQPHHRQPRLRPAAAPCHGQRQHRRHQRRVHAGAVQRRLL